MIHLHNESPRSKVINTIKVFGESAMRLKCWKDVWQMFGWGSLHRATRRGA